MVNGEDLEAQMSKILVCHDCGREFGDAPEGKGITYDTCPQCEKRGKKEMRSELRQKLPAGMTDEDMRGLIAATAAAVRVWRAEIADQHQVTLHLNLPTSKLQKRLNPPKKPE